MRKNKILVLSLALILGISLLVGCKGENKPEDLHQVSATPIFFNSLGSYKTTLKNVKANTLNKSDVKVVYNDLVKVNNEYVYTENEAKIKDIKVKDGDATVSFEGPSQTNYPVRNYVVKVFKKNAYANVLVKEVEKTITSDIEAVNVSDKSFKVTLSIENGEFLPNIKRQDIHLENGFRNLKIESLSSSAKFVTMQLSGTIKLEEDLNRYTNGLIRIFPHAIKDANKAVVASIKVLEKTFEFNPEALKFENNLLHLELVTRGLKEELTENDLNFSLGTIKNFSKDNENYLIDLEVKDAKDLESALEILKDSTVTILNEEVKIAFKEASFYPVFDFVETENDNFNLTLKIYVHDGSLKEEVKKENVILADDFKDAKVLDFKKDTNTTATLKLQVKTNGVSEENMNLNGSITLKDTLVNQFKTENKEASYTRNYSLENLGKDAHFKDDEEFSKTVGHFGSKELYDLVLFAREEKTLDEVLKSAFKLGLIEMDENNKLKAQSSKIHDDLEIDYLAQSKALEGKTYPGLRSFERMMDSLFTLDEATMRFAAMINQYVKDHDLVIPGENSQKEDFALFRKTVMEGLEKEENYGYKRNLRTIQYDLFNFISYYDANNMVNIYDAFNKFASETFNFSTSSIHAKYNLYSYSMHVISKAYSMFIMNPNFIANGNESSYMGQSSIRTREKINRAFDEMAHDLSKAKLNLDSLMPDQFYDYRLDYSKVHFYDKNLSLQNHVLYPNKFWEIEEPSTILSPYYQDKTSKLYFTGVKMRGEEAFLTDEEIATFKLKMHGRSFGEELELAGIFYRIPKLTETGEMMKDENNRYLYKDPIGLGVPLSLEEVMINGKVILRGKMFEFNKRGVSEVVFEEDGVTKVNCASFITLTPLDSFISEIYHAK